GLEKKIMPEEVFGIGSTDEMREKLSDAGIKQLDYGVITGLSAILLNEGRLENFDVITLVTPLYSQAEEYRAAVKLLETVNKLVPRLKIDVTELVEEAKKYEFMIKTLREQSKSVQPKAPELYI
ncbi:MAG: PAC2 family protein, partial [Nitrososphaeria archaeon]